MIGRPLEGVRVLDLGQLIAVPYATQVLGWLGAEVILVENPNLQPVRTLPPFADGIRGVNRSGGFNLLNTSKRSLVLDLNDVEGRGLARRLALISDVVVENFATGVVEKLGLDYDSLRRPRPDIVYLSVAAFGRSGPLKDFAGFHSVVNLFSGVAAVTGYPGGHPRILGGFPPDFIGGSYSLLAILQALHHRARTGQGQRIEVSMTEAFATLIPEAAADHSLHGIEPERVGNRDRAKAPHGIYRCAGEQRWVAISVADGEGWRALCAVAGQPEWADDPSFRTMPDRQANVAALDALIEAWTAGQDAADVARALQAAGVAATEVMSARDLLADEHLRERGFLSTVRHPETGDRAMGTTAWRIDGRRPDGLTPAPGLGEHTSYALRDLLALSEADVKRLEERGVAVVATPAGGT